MPCRAGLPRTRRAPARRRWGWQRGSSSVCAVACLDGPPDGESGPGLTPLGARATAPCACTAAAARVCSLLMGDLLQMCICPSCPASKPLARDACQHAGSERTSPSVRPTPSVVPLSLPECLLRVRAPIAASRAVEDLQRSLPPGTPVQLDPLRNLLRSGAVLPLALSDTFCGPLRVQERDGKRQGEKSEKWKNTWHCTAPLAPGDSEHVANENEPRVSMQNPANHIAALLAICELCQRLNQDIFIFFALRAC